MYIVAGCSPTTSNFIVLCFSVHKISPGWFEKMVHPFSINKNVPNLYLISSFSQLLKKKLQNLRPANENPCKIKRQTI